MLAGQAPVGPGADGFEALVAGMANLLQLSTWARSGSMLTGLQAPLSSNIRMHVVARSPTQPP